MSKDTRWLPFIPDKLGKYRVRDKIFGHKTYVRVFAWEGILRVKPEGESDDQSVDIRATPSWWELKEA